jgi:hypothetical protein
MSEKEEEAMRIQYRTPAFVANGKVMDYRARIE